MMPASPLKGLNFLKEYKIFLEMARAKAKNNGMRTRRRNACRPRPLRQAVFRAGRFQAFVLVGPERGRPAPWPERGTRMETGMKSP
jgi:hypothetical protein